MSKTLTKGGFDPEDLNIGDSLYEYEWGVVMESTVSSKPVCTFDEEGREIWDWEATHNRSGKIINYRVTQGYSHYGPNVYTYEAYLGCKSI